MRNYLFIIYSFVFMSVIHSLFLYQVRNGDNILFLFASVLPKLLSDSIPSCISKRFDQEKLMK